MAKKLTQKQRLRAYMAATGHQVMELLGWDMVAYSNFKYECGLLYLMAYLQGDMDAIDQMQRSALYWGWWKLHWYHRETAFLELVDMYKMGLQTARWQYRLCNNPDVLASAATEAGKWLEDSYCRELVPALSK